MVIYKRIDRVDPGHMEISDSIATRSPSSAFVGHCSLGMYAALRNLIHESYDFSQHVTYKSGLMRMVSKF